MAFYGLQRLTLLDFPGKVACSVFTAGCNMRCPYCHNASLVLPERFPAEIPAEEIFAYLAKRKGVLDGVCITGGEPLLHSDIAEFSAKVKGMGLSVKLDTNGSRPKELSALLNAGLVDYVAMDIKNSPENYAKTAGLPKLDLSPFRESVSMLMQGKVPYEFRTTVVKELHTLEDMEAIGQWIKGAQLYSLQSFLDSGDLLCSAFNAHSEQTMHMMAQTIQPYVQTVKIKGI